MQAFSGLHWTPEEVATMMKHAMPKTADSVGAIVKSMPKYNAPTEEITEWFFYASAFLRPFLESYTEYEFLEPGFLEAMNDIGRYGHEKYGKNSYQRRRELGDRSRSSKRVTKWALFKHGVRHWIAYLLGDKHDHFGTREHNLAAVAFNVMMEYYFMEGAHDAIR
ncbi:hypothetical protein KGP36_01715 [Patescibacteria group bacterium]|nr:hypothetical protein [Patescibacteria group bacterium]